MMKRWVVGVLASLWMTAAAANVPCSVPFNLLNGTTADATQVMANYNAILACLVNAAAAGANGDITSLTGLTTPLNAASGGSTTYVGGTSTGSANTQVLATLVPSGFSLVTGRRIIFLAGFTNTGPMTLTAAGVTATNVFANPSAGAPLALSGGEVQQGQLVEVTYDGTEFVLMNVLNPVQRTRIITGADQVQNSDNHGKIIMGGGAFYTLTLNAPATYTDQNLWVDVTNTDTIRAKLISVTGGTNFYLYPGQTRRALIAGIGAPIWTFNPSSQRWSHSGTQMFADPVNGNDVNDCLATGTGNACQHLCTAITRQITDIDHQNGAPTVNGAAGSYTESCAQAGQLTGTNVMFVTGASHSTTTWKPNGTSPNLFAQDNAEFIVNGFSFDNTGGSSGVQAFATHQTGILDVGTDTSFGTYSNGVYFGCDHGGGTINLPATSGITGSTGTVLQMGGGCTTTWAGGGTWTIGGGATCSVFASINGSGANVSMGLVTFSGSENAGCTQYLATRNATLSLGGSGTSGGGSGCPAAGNLNISAWGGTSGSCTTGAQATAN